MGYATTERGDATITETEVVAYSDAIIPQPVAYTPAPGRKPATTAFVCGGSVNVRELPTRESRWLAALPNGTKVQLIARYLADDWILIRHKKLQGYIYSQYICKKK